ncbi:unnamed protein product [Closterium sp. NIES-64]|nr:unnamed protein product [Closterium sp. NIES-64]
MHLPVDFYELNIPHPTPPPCRSCQTASSPASSQHTVLPAAGTAARVDDTLRPRCVVGEYQRLLQALPSTVQQDKVLLTQGAGRVGSGTMEGGGVQGKERATGAGRDGGGWMGLDGGYRRRIVVRLGKGGGQQ